MSAILHIDTGGSAYEDLVLDWGGEYFQFLDLYLDGARNAGDLYSDSDAAPGWKWGRYGVYNGVAEWTGEYVVRWMDSAQPQGAPILPTGHPGINDPYPNFLALRGWFRVAAPPSGATVLGISAGIDGIAGIEQGYVIYRKTESFKWFRATAHPSLPAGHALVSVGTQYLYNGQAQNPTRYEYSAAARVLGTIIRLPAPGNILRVSPTARLDVNGVHKDLWTQTGGGADDYVGLASDGCVFDSSNTVVSPPPSPGTSVIPFDFVGGTLTLPASP